MSFTRRKKRYQLVFALLMVLFVLASNAVGAEKELPLWEIGLGAAPLTMPSYRGSKNQEIYPILMPYIDYRGDFLRIDREGIRGLLYDSNRIRFELSGDGAIPSSTDNKGPRRGMPDLDPMLELGPSLNVMLYQSPRARLRVRLPVRAAMATDFSTISHEGWKFHPDINIEVDEALWGWDAGVAAGPLFADRDYHAFYYDVPERYAEPGFRKRYKASGGYSGTSLTFSASRRFEHIWAGLFFRYDNLSGAAFIDSPLVETRHSFMAGVGIAYVFWTSTSTVPATRNDF
ncbi:MAG: MipA/OmpV family protein [Desulfosalsimonadaceae bacterium]